jgi:DNA-binding response OmpR family regulator
MKSILFADNDPDFLDTRSEFLEVAGYQIKKAATFVEAERLLREAWYPLLIFDIRLLDDDDEKDLSGLSLAKLKICHAVAKIALSGYLTPEIVRELLRIQRSGQRLAVNVLSKEEGPKALVDAVNQTFNQHVGIDWNLEIDWRSRDRFSLVSLIEPDLENERLLNRSEEFEHLLRRLFYRHSYIKIDRLLWCRDGRIAFIIYNFKEIGLFEAFVVVCGTNEELTHETRQFKKYAPKAPSDNGTLLNDQAETTHFAANAYVLANADLASIRSLHDLYSTGPEKLFKTALTTLLEKTLAVWHQDKRIVEDRRTLAELHYQRLGLGEAHIPRPAFEARVKAILRQIPKLGINIELKNGKLNIHFGWLSFAYPDPTPLLYKGTISDWPVMLVNTPGALSGENILTNAEGHAWLTDFADAGLGPLLWNYTDLEAAIRFDWSETSDLQRLHELEHCLAVSRFSRPDMNLVEPEMKKPLRVIQSIRRLASPVVGKNETPYHIGIFFQAASRIAAYDPDYPCTTSEIARLAHALVAMAILSEKISQDGQHTVNPMPENLELRIDDQGVVWVRGMRLSIRGQGLDLLKYLNNRAGQVCKREELAKHVFGIKDFRNLPAKRKKAEENRMNAAIRRLREKIEDEPSHPRYLLTEPGMGYRLVRIPKI